ncbi:MAG TPA: hypothetical protein VEU94_12510 [Terriglobales bacterium]|nr:hypothetical protein [Terriglobales bacterium]
MSVSPKIARYPAPAPSVAKAELDVPARLVLRPVKLDFAARPKHHPMNGSGKIKKAKPSQGPRISLSPRLELSLEVQCDVVQEKDAEMEWWLSAMR